jgi:hypothetical protein
MRTSCHGTAMKARRSLQASCSRAAHWGHQVLVAWQGLAAWQLRCMCLSRLGCQQLHGVLRAC